MFLRVNSLFIHFGSISYFFLDLFSQTEIVRFSKNSFIRSKPLAVYDK